MYRTLLLATTLTAALAVGCGGGNSDGTITVDNASSHVLTEIRVTSVHRGSWGPNLLRDVLYPNEQLTVVVSCGHYDVLITDDRSRDCTLSDLDLCFSDQGWTIDDGTLRYCGY